jgi:hypothetical protein
MEYFIYASDAKVDMLLPQIPEKMKGKFALELGVNVGVFSAKMKGEEDLGLKSDRFSRLNAVIKYLKNSEEIGSVDDPKSWIEGTEQLRIVYPTEHKEAVFFVGQSKEKIRITLAGSAAYLTSKGTGVIHDVGWSFLPDLLIQLRMVVGAFENPEIEDRRLELLTQCTTTEMESEWMGWLASLERNARGPSMTLKFLARRLLTGVDADAGRKVLLGTPLYVAYADELMQG